MAINFRKIYYLYNKIIYDKRPPIMHVFVAVNELISNLNIRNVRIDG